MTKEQLLKIATDYLVTQEVQEADVLYLISRALNLLNIEETVADIASDFHLSRTSEVINVIRHLYGKFDDAIFENAKLTDKVKQLEAERDKFNQERAETITVLKSLEQDMLEMRRLGEEQDKFMEYIGNLDISTRFAGDCKLKDIVEPMYRMKKDLNAMDEDDVQRALQEARREQDGCCGRDCHCA